MKVGIVGLPNVGKSTLFNALLKRKVALTANYPFATVEPNVGVVAVPDDRLEKLAELVKKEEKMDTLPPVVPAVVEFVDIAGLVKGANLGAGLGNQFLSHIREVDAIVHVLRDFQDENVIREGSVSPDEDRLTVETELGLADLQVIEKLISGQDKQTRTTHDPLDQTKLVLLNKLKDMLDKVGSFDFAQVFDSEVAQTRGDLRDDRLKDWFSHLPLLSIKPVLYVYNVSEDGYNQTLRRLNGTENEMAISAKLEEELADLSEGERLEYLKELGVEESGLERLIRKVYQLLGLVSFFTTTGKKEARAWTLRRGETALRAAGIIHSDFEKKFIRAEVIEYGKLIEAGSMQTAKSKGWVRTEGKDYEIKDGDVIEFLVGS